MSDLISIQSGDVPPWRPTSDAELLYVFDERDVPVMGHLRQRAVDYVFWCAFGATDEFSVWAYSWVTEAEIEALKRSVEFDVTFARTVAGRPLVIAFYDENQGIIGSVIVQHPASYDSLSQAVVAELRSLQRTFDQTLAASS